MILAVREWAKRGANSFEAGEYFGARVAHTDLVRAALQYSFVERVHLFSDNANPYSEGIVGREAADSASSLLDEFGSERVRLLHVTEWENDLRKPSRVAFASGPALASLTAARSGSGGMVFPVCSLLHAARWDTIMLSYSYALLFARNYDVLVTTSAAAEYAAQEMLESARRLLAGRSRNAVADDILTNQLRLVRIPLGIEESEFAPLDKEQCRKEFNIEVDATVVLYFGRLTERHKADLESLVLAAGKLARTVPNVLLLIVGHDEGDRYGQQLTSIAHALNLGTQMRVIPDVSGAAKRMIYTAADIFVSPVDNVQESFGLSLLEAMAAELPVIASDWSGYRDIVENEKTGLLVPTYWSSAAARVTSQLGPLRLWLQNDHYLAQRTIVDSLRLYKCLYDLATNKEKRRAYGRAGRQRVQAEFAWRSVASKYGALWQEQLEMAHSARKNGDAQPDPVLDYDSVFRHYATAVIGSECDLVLDRDLARYDGLLAKRFLQLPNAKLLNEVARVSCECAQSPRTLGKLLSEGTPETLDAALWLLKKGYCYLKISP